MASQRELPDAEARLTVANEIDRTLFVEAGAGTGKTTSLISRIVSMVKGGTPIGRIAAITFTEAAASELRVRVRTKLFEKGTATNDRAMLEAAAEVEAAAFTTLHGFALRLLLDHPIEVGLPPGFSVADEIGSALQFELAWKDFTTEMFDQTDNLDLFERAAILGVGLGKFGPVARAFDDNWDLLDQVKTPLPLEVLDFTETYKQFDSLTSVVAECDDPDDKLKNELERFKNEVEKSRHLDPQDQLAALANLRYPKKHLGKKGNWPGTSKDEIADTIVACETNTRSLIERLQEQVIDQIVAMVADFIRQQATERRQSGQLSFHDLLVLARQLLRDDDHVRRRLHQRYPKILLDEFQDTDPIQIELAVLLATDDDLVGDRPWQKIATGLRPGRLVVVGDPKQSIYRFRRADIGVYSEAESALVDEPTRLTTNFRSVPGIIEWVNHMFGSLMGEGDSGVQPAYTPLQPYRTADHATKRAVRTIGGPSDDNIDTIRRQEATDIAAVICDALKEDWRVEHDGVWQPVRLSDIAVLIPSRGTLPALETAFENAGITFRPETSSLVYSTQEIRDVLSGISAVTEPTNEVAIVAALRSSLFGIGDDELVSWDGIGGGWDYRCEPEPEQQRHPIAEAFAALRCWHDTRWWIEPAELINTIVRDRRLREQALGSSRPRDRWRRYRFLAEQARHFTATYGGGIYSFVEWVEVQSSDTARVVEPIPPEPDDDAVRILTIHGSKGLEFPMVIVAGGASQNGGSAAGVQTLFPSGASPQVKLGHKKSTSDFSKHASVELALESAEQIRLDYVAATRAKDLLVISAHHKVGPRNTTSSGYRTWDCMQEAPSLWQRYEYDGVPQVEPEAPAQLRLTSGTFDQALSLWKEQQVAIQLDNSSTRKWTATEVSLALQQHQVSSPNADGELTTSVDGVVGGAALGTAVHDVLAHIDVDAPDRTARLVEASALRHGVAAEAKTVAALVEAAVDSDLFLQAATVRRWRELYVSMPTSDGSLEGYIDLCFETDQGLVIVDYKTDRSQSSDRDTEIGRYQFQLAAYALALEHITAKPVVGAYVLFLQVDGAAEHKVTDLEQTKDQVRELLGLLN